MLAQCYRNSFALVEEYDIRTVAFPSISTGAYGFPMERAAGIAVTEVKDFLQKDDAVEKVYLVCYGQRAYDIHLAAVRKITG